MHREDTIKNSLNDLTVIVRTIGERTTDLCLALLKDQIEAHRIHIVSENPFTSALRKTFEIGIKDAKKWTLVIDADVFICRGVIIDLISFAENLNESVFEVEGKIVDKFLDSPREAGNHLYRTKLLEKALKMVPDAFSEIRPETFVKDAMKAAGYPWMVVDFVAGIHDFEQYYRDIYRKCFIQAKKHYDRVMKLIPDWEEKSKTDDDFKVALKGFWDGCNYSGSLAVDADLPIFSKLDLDELGLEEKTPEIDGIFSAGLLSDVDYQKYKKNRKAKCVIYTAIVGSYDELVQPMFICPDFDYVCFSEQAIETPGIWEVRELSDKNADPVRRAKFYKLFPDLLFPECEYSVWMDGNIDIMGPIFYERVHELIGERVLIAAPPHFSRDCVYDEAENCIAAFQDHAGVIQAQVRFLEQAGFPKNQGLFEMNLLFRRHHDKKVKKMMTDWHDVICQYSRRDQLSFMYVLWKNEIECTRFFLENIRKRSDFIVYPHSFPVQTKLYLGCDEFFADVVELKQRVLVSGRDNRFQVKFHVPDSFSGIYYRYYPLVDSFCRFRLHSVVLKTKAGKTENLDFAEINHNASTAIESDFIFDATLTPIIEFSSKLGVVEIDFIGELWLLDPIHCVDRYVNEKQNEIGVLKAEINQANCELELERQQLKKLMNDLKKNRQLVESARLLRKWQKHNKKGTAIVIFGTGALADWFLLLMDKNHLSIKCFFDNSSRFASFHGIPVQKPEYIPGVKVVVASMYQAEIVDQLKNLGYREADLFLPIGNQSFAMEKEQTMKNTKVDKRKKNEVKINNFVDIETNDFHFMQCCKLYAAIFISGFVKEVLDLPQRALVDVKCDCQEVFAVSNLKMGASFAFQLLLRQTDFVDDLQLELVLSDGSTKFLRLIDIADQAVKARCGAERKADGMIAGSIFEEFVKLIEQNRFTRILDLGGRARSGILHSKRFQGKQVQVMDILPGEGVDIVGDAHRMSEFIPLNSFDAIFSVAVFEHLIMPWKVAVEINRILRPGGLAYIKTHQTIGMHDRPWDYFRFSDTSWKGLFNKHTGFDIIGTELDGMQQILPFAYAQRYADVEKTAGFEHSAVLVRKSKETDLDWPLGAKEVTDDDYPE